MPSKNAMTSDVRYDENMHYGASYNSIERGSAISHCLVINVIVC